MTLTDWVVTLISKKQCKIFFFFLKKKRNIWWSRNQAHHHFHPRRNKKIGTDAGSVIHPSVSQSISHPASECSIWFRKQWDQVMWVIRRKSRIQRKTQSHDPYIIPRWLTSHLCLHSPVCLLSQASLFKLVTHLFTQSTDIFPRTQPKAQR